MFTGTKTTSHIHLIINRDWSLPLTIYVDRVPLGDTAWKQVVSATTTLKLAIELFFKVQDFGIGLYGLDLTQISTDQQISFIEYILTNSLLHPTTSVLMEAWQKWIAPAENAPFFNSCTAIDIGLLKHWSDTSLCHVWSYRNGQPQMKKLMKETTLCKYLNQQQDEEIVLEFQYDLPVAHWYALQVSSLIEGKHRLSLGFVAKILYIYNVEVGF